MQESINSKLVFCSSSKEKNELLIIPCLAERVSASSDGMDMFADVEHGEPGIEEVQAETLQSSMCGLPGRNRTPGMSCTKGPSSFGAFSLVGVTRPVGWVFVVVWIFFGFV